MITEPEPSVDFVDLYRRAFAYYRAGKKAFDQQHGICLLRVRYVAAITTEDGEPHCLPRRSPARFLQLMLTAFTGTIRLLDDRAVLTGNRPRLRSRKVVGMP